LASRFPRGRHGRRHEKFAEKFSKKFPDRFTECFIAEQNMVGVAVGFGTRGKVPFASTFACFLARAYDQIRVAGISMANLKLAGSHVGVSIGEDGPSQMALEDLAMMRAIAGSVCCTPATPSLETCRADGGQQRHSFSPRPSKTPVIYSNDEPFTVGGAKVLRQGAGDKVTVVAAGVTLHEALKAADALKQEGVGLTVIDAYSVKPLGKDVIKAAAQKTNNTISRSRTIRRRRIGDGSGWLSADGIKVQTGGAGVALRASQELVAWAGIDASAIAQKVKALA
jgi:transketolase